MLDTVVSGGQTGADQAGWRTAQAFGVPTGGWMPRGFVTEEGPRPEFAERFGAREIPTEDPEARTEQNVRDADATVWFGDTTTSSAHATVAACQRWGKPCLPIAPVAVFQPPQVAAWLTENRVQTLNVAGNCESDEHGIGERVERFLSAVLRELGHAPSAP
jgi:hypothetical protein